jgi:hypothetical protein
LTNKTKYFIRLFNEDLIIVVSDEDAVIDQTYVGQPPSQNVYTPYLSQSPINGKTLALTITLLEPKIYYISL